MHTLAQLKAGELTGLKLLKLSEKFTEFPAEIFTLADSLEILDLSGNQLQSLPENFGRLIKLKIIFLSDNHFTELPAVLGTCPELEMIGFKANQIRVISLGALPQKLRWLILTDNQLQELPEEIGNCSRLQKLMLAGNELQALPASLANCRQLELVRLSANNFTKIPEVLFELPRLSWLALAGNPASDFAAEETSLPEINWQELELEHLLGEGASGLIYQANRNQSDGNKSTVAVKIFKGHVTSDGFPKDEMAATLAAGNHPNLVGVLGKLKSHPNGKSGLVFSLIPPEFKNLGQPPSFETCTRDIFPNGTVFSLKTVQIIANGIASAAVHLHSRGILHGDLYAHNILVNSEGEPLLGDFGAATSYLRSDKKLANWLEGLEVRAFGFLLDDLLARLAPDESNHPLRAAFESLKQACLEENYLNRPDFASINLKLATLESAIPTT